MRKSLYHGKDYIYNLLYTGNAKSFISGSIYKDSKPNGSILEDIVINGVSADNELLQDGVFNVNCYVPFVEVSIGNTIQKMPNNKRLREIFESIHPLIDEKCNEDFDCIVDRHLDFEEQSEEMSYVNFRVNLKMYN